MNHRWAALSSLLVVPVALAQDAEPAAQPLTLSLSLTTQPESKPAAEVPADEIPSIVPAKKPFGIEGTQWLTLGLALGDDFNESTDFNIHGAWSRFLADDIEFSAELAVWYFDQEGPNAYGINPNMVFRWHVLRKGDWTAYMDAGIGVLLATDSVPDGGSNFNLMPRAGVGLTYGLTEDTRLQFGLRWHHVSNARITGDASNPARDGPLLYIGLIHRF